MKYTWVGPSGVAITADMNTDQNHNILRNQLTTDHDPIRQSSHSPTRKAKRYRSAFTTDQIDYLEKQFQKFPYIGSGHRKDVAIALNIPERAVKIWFQNRRMKEKKETMNKEMGDQKPEEFVKDQLNNVLALPSPNEPRSLPVLTDQNKCTTSIKNKVNCVPTTEKSNYFKDIPSNESSTAALCSPSPKLNKSPDYKTTAHFSIDLCKKYKNETNSIPTHQDARIVSQNVPSSQRVQPIPERQTAIQDSPEDLSSWKKPHVQTLHTPRPNISTNSRYVPVIPSFYAQPYLPPGNMLWKPVNVMPLMSTGASAVSISSTQSGNLSVTQDHVQKRCCNCDCHLVKTVQAMPMNFQGQVSPQYILATVPYQSNIPKY